MPEKLKQLPLNLLLRNFFAGLFFIMAFAEASGQTSDIEKLSPSSLTLILLLSFALGLVGYTAHRSITHPLWEAWRDKRIANGSWCSMLTDDIIIRIIDRWKATLGSDNDEPDKAIYIGLASWADYIHFQLSSALCIGLGALAGTLYGGGSWSVPNLPLISLFVILSLGGYLSDIRRQLVENYALPIKKKEKADMAMPRKPSDQN